MTIPDYQTLMLPLLRLAARDTEVDLRTATTRLADEFALTEAERARLLPSGRQTIIANRVHWAGTYLVKAGLLDRPRRGHRAVTERGRQVLACNPPRIDNRFLKQFPEFLVFLARSGRSAGAASATVPEGVSPLELATPEQATPEERIEAAHAEITEDLRSELLQRIRTSTPRFFEKVIVDLMLAMGYGGTNAEAGQRLGRGGDGGIDGLINEDILGLDTIYLQAKRYGPDNPVGVEKVKEFAGSLMERGASKGVFVTTSSFTSGAESYPGRIKEKLILIDGERLSDLMVRYNVGVREERAIVLKKIDNDYFDEDELD